MRPGLRRALDKGNPVGVLIDQLERTKASIRARVEHPFRVIKQQFGYVKVRYRVTCPLQPYQSKVEVRVQG
ncbi:transposase, IS5 family domain protein [Acidovorax sp. RAC01]|nr:transposase, IS5 family domain protein [Acidovorax sp. RAC01]